MRSTQHYDFVNQVGWFLYCQFAHEIGFSNVIDFRVKKPMILCTHRMSRSSEQSTNTDHTARTCEQSTNTDHTARTCGRLIYSIVKITKLYDYQTWQTHFWINLRSAQRYVGFFFLDCAFGRSNGCNTSSDISPWWRLTHVLADLILYVYSLSLKWNKMVLGYITLSITRGVTATRRWNGRKWEDPTLLS